MKKKILTILLSSLIVSISVLMLSDCKCKHSYTTKVIEPTCTEQGYTIYTCKCGETYNSDYVNAKGHNYVVTYEWEDNICTARAICSRDNSHQIIETVTSSYVKDKSATCTDKETGHYVATFENILFETQKTLSQSVSVGEELNHNYIISYEWEDNICTAKAICSRDNSHELIETVTASYVKNESATCTTKETGHYVATFKNNLFETQTTIINSVSVGSELGHSFTNYVCNNDATDGTNGTATAICDRINCNQTDTITACSIRATFKVNGEEIDDNYNIVMGDIVLIKAYVNEQLETNIRYKAIKIDSDVANNYEFTITNGEFVAGFVGYYEIYVYYEKDGKVYQSQTYVLRAVANKNVSRYIETFSNSSSVASVYKVGDNESNYSAYKTNYDIYANNTTYLNEFEGRYGVVKTKPQNDYINSSYKGARLGINLRSTEYKTLNDMNKAKVTKTVYGMNNIPAKGHAKYNAYNCDEWDYISVWIYLPKLNAKLGETIKISSISLIQQFDVPYNVWYELKLDKTCMMGTFAGDDGYILNQYQGDKTDATPTFFLAYDDVSSQSNINQVVYIDSISFEKYKEYQKYDQIYFYEETTKHIISTLTVNNLQYTLNGTTMNPISLVLNAYADGKEVDFKNIKTKYLSFTSNLNIKCYNANGEETQTINGYDIKQNDGIFKVVLTGIIDRLDYFAFCFIYEDIKTGIKYISYRMLSFNMYEKK